MKKSIPTVVATLNPSRPSLKKPCLCRQPRHTARCRLSQRRPRFLTGLRIGVSTAKGLCYGRDTKLISIPTLKVLCTRFRSTEKDIPDNAPLCPMIDARRMEVYTAIYDRALHEVGANRCRHRQRKLLRRNPDKTTSFLFPAMVSTNAATRSSIPTPIS